MTAAGRRIGDGSAVFDCAACGRRAGVLWMPNGTADAGVAEPLGQRPAQRCAGVIDYDLQRDWRSAGRAGRDHLREILSGDRPDPGSLWDIDWELAPFFCACCGLVYCRAHWHNLVLAARGTLGATLGTCPRGHGYRTSG